MHLSPSVIQRNIAALENRKVAEQIVVWRSFLAQVFCRLAISEPSLSNTINNSNPPLCVESIMRILMAILTTTYWYISGVIHTRT